MKKLLLATVAVSAVAMAGPASAQSLLERVLTDLNGTTENVTGIFANTADNLAIPSVAQDVTSINGTTETVPQRLSEGDIVVVLLDIDPTTNVDNRQVPVQYTLNSAGNTIVTVVETVSNGTNSISAGSVVSSDPTLPDLGAQLYTNSSGDVFGTLSAAQAFGGTNVLALTTQVTTGDQIFSTSGINASVTNIISELNDPDAAAGGAAAFAAVDFDIGNITTTALGAVNTGEITLLGANAVITEGVDQAIASADTSALTQDVSYTISQLGTLANQTVLAVNSALNETNVNASVLTVTNGVNGTLGRSGFESSATFDSGELASLFTAAASATDPTVAAEIAAQVPDAIAALTGGITTTALGAVNTGKITSGANNTVNGVISSIVGNAAVNAGN